MRPSLRRAIGRPGLATLVAAVALAWGAATAAAADPPPETVVIFDGSNSMNGRMTGDQSPKHVVVREALRRALPRLASGTRVGLAAFGHRRVSDCNDAAMVVPISAEPQRMIDELERFRPRGFSPVALSLREAAGALAGARGAASILLVVDDLASCRTEDPCTVAADLVARNPRLRIGVIGLGLNAAAIDRMICVADVGKGRFADVQDARDLDAAVDLVLLAAAKAPVATAGPVSAAAVAPRTTSAVTEAAPPIARGLNLSARLAERGPTLARPIRWRVWRDGDEPGAQPVAEAEQAAVTFDLPSGTYRVEARLGSFERRQSVTVTEGEATVVPVAFDAGLARIAVRLAKSGAPLPGALVTAIPGNPGPNSGDGAVRSSVITWLGDAELLLPAGSWHLTAELGLARIERTVAIAAGQTLEADLSLEAGRLQLTAEPASPGLRYAVSEDDPDSPDGRREVARSAAPNPVFVLPAGAYNLSVRRGAAEVRERVVIRAGEEVQRRLVLGSARVRVATRLQPQADRAMPVSTRVLRLDGAEREIARSADAEPVFDLAPGRYRIESRVGTQNAVARRDIDVRGDGEQRLLLDHAAGVVLLRMVTGGAGLQFGEVFWTIVDQAGQQVWRSGQPEPLVVLAAGRYTARVDARGAKYERTFDVRSGDTSRLDVGG